MYVLFLIYNLGALSEYFKFFDWIIPACNHLSF